MALRPPDHPVERNPDAVLLRQFFGCRPLPAYRRCYAPRSGTARYARRPSGATARDRPGAAAPTGRALECARPEPAGAPPGVGPAPHCTPRHALPYPPREAVVTLGQVHAIRADKDNESGDLSRES